jgi:hypothetical protein
MDLNNSIVSKDHKIFKQYNQGHKVWYGDLHAYMQCNYNTFSVKNHRPKLIKATIWTPFELQAFKKIWPIAIGPFVLTTRTDIKAIDIQDAELQFQLEISQTIYSASNV